MQNKYPLWKNLTLVIIAVIGLIYAIPSLYSEDPAVQITSESSSEPQQLEQKVKGLLDNARLPYRSINESGEHVEIRFASTDTQLLARDVIKNGLGEGYVVALNLAPSTPSWLETIGAAPMKQGLDLRGGVHFLLDVDIDSVISRRYEGLTKSMGQDLREANIRYAGIRFVADQGVNIHFRNEEALIDASIRAQI